MTKESLAAMLDGRSMGDEITEGEEKLAKEAGLVVVFGYSDDNAEFRGAIHDEVSCYDGGTILVHKEKGVFRGEDHHSCDCDHCGYKSLEKSSRTIEAVWGDEGFSWTYKTEIPHATFVIREDANNFCRGIVFSMADI